jgi:hypothetical protein
LTAFEIAYSLARRCTVRLAVVVLAAALPVGCAAPPPANPFAGAWTTGERQHLAFRDDTVVIGSPDAVPTALSATACDGTFRFGYGRESRGALLGLPLHQPDLQTRLAAVLTQPDYPVAELVCGEGGTVYVLLNDHDVLAIHRDRDIAGIEHLSRL